MMKGTRERERKQNRLVIRLHFSFRSSVFDRARRETRERMRILSYLSSSNLPLLFSAIKKTKTLSSSSSFSPCFCSPFFPSLFPPSKGRRRTTRRPRRHFFPSLSLKTLFSLALSSVMLLYTTTPTAKKRGMNRDIYNEEKMCVLSQTLVFSSSFLSSLSSSSSSSFSVALSVLLFCCSSFVFFLVFRVSVSRGKTFFVLLLQFFSSSILQRSSFFTAFCFCSD